ncbi:MAG TPA: MFS transporter [Blastocatellia bacterium]|jgi:FSR family fosmidomycin resistance protein-like MFS transporter
MSIRRPVRPALQTGKARGRVLSFTLTLLLIEFLDELIFGGREAAWPLIRDDLGLSYVQIGMLLSLPSLIGHLIEMLLGILADVWNRRALVLAGGMAYALALLMISSSNGFTLLMVAFILCSPASGAFVGLSQATLMDSDAARHEHNMARWTLFGSLGMVLGPLALGAAVMLGSSWRGLFFAYSLLALALLKLASRFPFPIASNGDEQARAPALGEGARKAFKALKQREVLRWLLLLQFSDLMLDVLNGFLALYFVDVVGVNELKAGMAIGVWTGVGLPGDLLLIPLLERMRGLRYLRISALLVLLLFPAFLLAPGYAVKLVILGLLGLLNAGWYSILKAQLYSSMPGLSGTVMSLGSVFGIAGGMIPLGLGIVAERLGLSATMWLLLLSPIALLIGIPRIGRQKAVEN